MVYGVMWCDEEHGASSLCVSWYCVLHAACCVLRAACCVLRVACCVLRAACCVLRVACCVLITQTHHLFFLSFSFLPSLSYLVLTIF